VLTTSYFMSCELIFLLAHATNSTRHSRRNRKRDTVDLGVYQSLEFCSTELGELSQCVARHKSEKTGAMGHSKQNIGTLSAQRLLEQMWTFGLFVEVGIGICDDVPERTIGFLGKVLPEFR
jgi:hypothetical protein